MEWKEVRLESIAEVQTGPFGSQLHNEDYVSVGTPIVTVEHLGNKFFTTQNLPCVTEEDKERLNKYVTVEGDIVFSRVGSVDRCSYVNKETAGWLFSGRCLRVRAKKAVDSEFLYYFFTKESTKSFIRNIAVGATMPSINTKLLNEVVVRYPDNISIQRRIASILSSLDRKIELNNKINAQLEEMAQAIFKSWFVDFEPFKDGKFVESELGIIPEGWRVGKIGDIASTNKKSINPAKMVDTLFSHYSLPAFDDGKRPAFQYGSEIMSNKLSFESRTTLLSKLNPHIKRVWFVDEVEKNPICSTEFIPIKAKDENLSAFIHCCINSDYYYGKAVSAVNGATTSHQRIHPDDVMNMEIVYNEDCAHQFSRSICPLLQNIERNIKENLHLSQLRDTLLPKLMSGEIDLDEIEKTI